MLMSDLASRRMDAVDSWAFARPGAGKARRAAISAMTLEWLAGIWNQATQGIRTEGVALLALGSTARGDAGPLSDLDLVLIHDDRRPAQHVAGLADSIWYPIWDQKVTLDHSVRTVAQCREVAADDLPATIGLLDLSLVAGDADIAAAVRSTLVHDWRAAARRRLPDVLKVVADRHERHGDLAHLLEPDLKEARGGLRDMSVLRALTTAWLADRPHGDVDAAYGSLLDVRDAIHIVTGRARNKLLKQDQDAVAALLGLPGGDHLLRQVSESARVLTAAGERTIRRAAQSQRARAPRSGARRPTLRPLGYGLYAHDGEAVLGPKVDPAADPLTALRAAVVAARAGLPLAPATVDNLAQRVPALPYPWPDAARDLFGDLLASGEGLIAVWESLTLAGVVESWLPDWTQVRSHPQHNAVHRHTVDRHQVQTVVEAQAALADVHRPDLLLFTCLVHDMGKATSDSADDHSAVGTPLARQMAQRVGFPAEDVAVIGRLVAQHLTLVELATRRDPRDPRTVEALADAVDGSADILDLLRALTEADARAVGPSAWTGWRVRLVDDLTAATRAHLRRTDGITPHLPVEADPGPAALTPDIRSALAADGIHVQVASEDHGQVVTVAMPDRLGLFADVAGVLAVMGTTVRRAEARTEDGIAVDTWFVESPGGGAVEPEALRRALTRIGKGDRTPLRGLSGRAPARRHVAVPLTRALVLPDEASDATVIELRGPDRPGLLHDVGRCLAEHEVSIRSAHVTTLAGQAVDTLYVTEPKGGALSPARVGALIGGLIDAADAAP